MGIESIIAPSGGGGDTRMLLYEINTYRDNDKIYIKADNVIFELDPQTFANKRVNALPQDAIELPFEILLTKKVERERYYLIEIYSDTDIYVILHYDPYTATSRIVAVSLNEKYAIGTLEQIQ